MDREEGYYFVMLNLDWMPAEYLGKGNWYIIGMVALFFSDDFDEIGDKIEMPE